MFIYYYNADISNQAIYKYRERERDSKGGTAIFLETFNSITSLKNNN